jgi:hypothetical protein
MLCKLSTVIAKGMNFWFKVVEEYVPHLHLRNFNYNFNVVTWSITGNMVGTGVTLTESEGVNVF